MRATTKIKTIKQAMGHIIARETLPPQIDYSLPYTQKAWDAAYYLDKVKKTKPNLVKEAYRRIALIVDAYYTPNIKGEDGQYYSVAALDAMF